MLQLFFCDWGGACRSHDDRGWGFCIVGNELLSNFQRADNSSDKKKDVCVSERVNIWIHLTVQSLLQAFHRAAFVLSHISECLWLNEGAELTVTLCKPD